MSGSPQPETPGGWGGARWVLAAVALIFSVAVAVVVPSFRRLPRPVGDGENVESYGFDLSSSRIDLGGIVAAGVAKGGIRALDAPEFMAGSEVLAFNAAHRGRYLTSDDRVVGVVIGGEARAYPLRVLNWHEIINDTVGGMPIAVTYHPLCDSVVVFDRRVGAETLELGVSGLLYNSNLLLYDRHPHGSDESLWSQLQARAVAGPAAVWGRTLTVLPSSLARWDSWVGRHPGSLVIRPAYALLERYRRDPYGSYLLDDDLRFPVTPLPPGDDLPLKARVLVVLQGPRPVVLPLDARLGDEDLPPSVEVDRTKQPFSVLLGEDARFGTVHALWFAWYSQHPGSTAGGSAADPV